MATFDTTATLSQNTTNVPAPRPDGKNLLIKIEVGTGTFHCLPEEHVGTHKNRFVTFQPDASCTLYFTNIAVFQMTDKRLVKGNNDLQVLDQTNGVETSYSLIAPAVLGPPKIVVP